jgi:glycosyltransferase involved in cell wall biosynthesis
VTGQHRPEWPLAEEIAGIQVHRLPYPKVRLLGLLMLLWRTSRFLLTQGRRFHIFHVHTVSALAVLTILMGRLLGKAVILKAVGAWELEQGVLNPARRRQLLYRGILVILRRADVWVAVSEHLRRAIADAGVPPERIVTIPNGVDTVGFAPRPAREEQEKGTGVAPQAVFVGRLVKEKGLLVLLQAWVLVMQRIRGAALHVVGGGPLEDELRALVRHLGIASSVRFHGHQQEVLPFLQAADLFVLPSYVEGLSNTLLEAMAVGLPVVATRISGSEDIVDEGKTGFLVPPGEVPALAEAIIALLENPAGAAAMGRQARQRVVQRCGLECVTSSYICLYQQILKNDGAGLCVVSPAS